MMTQQRLTRSSTNQVIGGVCGGLGQYFGIDPVIVRLIMIALLFADGMGLLVYLVLWLIMPVDGTPQGTIGEGLRDIQQQVQAFGQQASQHVQSAFGTPRFDPQTGQPVSTTPTEQRNRTLGLVLLGVGGFMLASLVPYGSQIIMALMIVGGGVYLLRRSA
jgi:phage shock protein C